VDGAPFELTVVELRREPVSEEVEDRASVGTGTGEVDNNSSSISRMVNTGLEGRQSKKSDEL